MLMRRLLCIALALSAKLFAQASAPVWKFAISGDSRNCGDIVMPAIAAGVANSGSEFYWHLGDFRALYNFDEDLGATHGTISDYQRGAWPDFISHQLDPFGKLPVYLGMGNHETVLPATRENYIVQFADWLDAPVLKTQRLQDDPQDHRLRTYYHWIDRGIDFITLDNASPDQFDAAQLKWFHAVIEKAEASPDIKTVVVGMHAALPGSVGASHSMSDWAQGEKSGRDVYQTLWHTQDTAHKTVYVLASHSHFFMEDVYQTDYWKGRILKGFIVGTAGAVRYRLPPGVVTSDKAMTDVYGYLLANVMSDGTIAFSFQKLEVDQLLHANANRLPEALVRWCFTDNRQLSSAH